ncbi:MAG: ferritin family protein [Roseiarcus sp.]
MKRFDEMSETEILALAISNEEEDSRIYADFAHSLRNQYPATAKVFDDMAAEEGEHRRQLKPPVAAAAKVMLGGGLVLATGILIGTAG